MSNPSLLCVPYRFKTSKLYSQIPDSGLGDFVVTRSASNSATRVNAQGFIETVADNVPRLDYPLGGITAGCPALLVEPSAQNLALQSTFSTGWSTTLSGSVSGNASGTNSPEGSGNAALLSVVATAFSSISRTITTVSGSVYTASVFAKKRDKDFLYFVNLAGNTAVAWFNLASGTVGTVGANTTARIENYGNGWYRCSITQTAGGTTSYIQFGLSDANNTNAAASSGSNFVFGAQFELGSVPTSYIPTTTAAITRGAEVVSKTGVSSLIGQTEGTIYAEFINTFSSSYNDGVLIRVFSDANNEVFGRKEAASNRYTFRWRANSQNTTFTSVNVPDGVNKVAIAYKSGDTALFLNGVQIGSTSTDVRAFSVNPTTVALGSNGGLGQFFNDRIRAHALYPTRLTNAQLQSLTQ